MCSVCLCVCAYACVRVGVRVCVRCVCVRCMRVCTLISTINHQRNNGAARCTHDTPRLSSRYGLTLAPRFSTRMESHWAV